MEQKNENLLGASIAINLLADESGVSTAVFLTRNTDIIVCPICNRRQMPNRNCCYSCGCLFAYEDDTVQEPEGDDFGEEASCPDNKADEVTTAAAE